MQYLAENMIEYADSEKIYRGGFINKSFSFNQHCDTILSKANQQYGLLKRTCHFVRVFIFGEIHIPTKIGLMSEFTNIHDIKVGFKTRLYKELICTNKILSGRSSLNLKYSNGMHQQN